VYIAVSVIVALGATDGTDEWWNDRMIDAETASLVRVAEAFGVLGSVTVAGVIAVVTVAVLAALRRWSPAIAVVSMAVLALVVSQLTKSIVDRPRPPDGLEVETSASYPSASVMVSATAIVLGIAVVVAGMVPRWGSVSVGTPAAVMAAPISAIRPPRMRIDAPVRGAAPVPSIRRTF
jgi:undecaprenyl-diphosphatase